MQCLQLTRGDPPRVPMKWYFNKTITLPEKGTRWEINFVLGDSNNYFNLHVRLDEQSVKHLMCYIKINFGGTIGSREVDLYSDSDGWVKSAYRTITFDTPPTGTLLSWLKDNATPQ